MGLAEWAYQLSGSMLADPLPRRWSHVLGVAARAHSLHRALGAEADLIEAAALLHDIGYSPSIAKTDFHPLDGARFLRDQTDADVRLTRLVAHHSYALLEAEERGLWEELTNEFRSESTELADALTFCDMTTTPDGKGIVTSTARIGEITERYGADSAVGRYIRRAAPRIHAAVKRTEATWANHDAIDGIVSNMLDCTSAPRPVSPCIR